MPKEKKSTKKKEDIWDQIVASITEANKEEVVNELEKIIKLLEERNNVELLNNFKTVLQKIK
jgi:Asp-tRNA(Asn)/Glu-tRNA(Gln) amidotransferase C subunit